jgi:hypothetical protein
MMLERVTIEIGKFIFKLLQTKQTTAFLKWQKFSICLAYIHTPV